MMSFDLHFKSRRLVLFSFDRCGNFFSKMLNDLLEGVSAFCVRRYFVIGAAKI